MTAGVPEASPADVWADLGNDVGNEIAADLVGLVRRYEEGRERSQQRSLGPSGIGSPCTRCLARSVLGLEVQREFDDPWCSIIGTAVHTWLDEAAVAECIRLERGRWLAEMRVYPDPTLVLLPKGGRCDLYDAEKFRVIDHKVVGAAQLKKYRALGPGAQYRYQGHLYGLGIANQGKRVDTVAIAFWLRGGRLSDLWVWTEPYSPAVAQEALDRYAAIRHLALTTGPSIIPLLPADPDCWDCGGRDDL